MGDALLLGRSRAGIARRAMVTGVVVLAFLPIVIVLAAGLWIPVAMMHETFGVHYVPYALMGDTYYFVRNAHLFALTYTYLPSAFAHEVLTGLSDVDRMQVYGLLVYAWHGLLLAVATWVALRSSLTPPEKGLVFLVAFAPPYLTPRMINPLTINYHMLETVLYVGLAVASVRWLTGESSPGFGRPALLGAGAALAVGTKLSLVAIMAPFFVLLALPRERNGLKVVSTLGLFALAFLGVLAIGALAYCRFHLDYAVRLVGDLIELSRDPSWLAQNVPPLRAALPRWLDPESIVFGFQMTVTLWVGMLAGAVAWWVWRPDGRICAFLTVSGVVGTFLGYVLWRRTAPNTVLDIVLFALFQLAVLGSLYVRRLQSPLVAWGAISLVLAAIGVECFLYEPSRVLGELRAVSATSRRLHQILDAHPELPIVYYMTHTNASLLFPSAHLYPLVSGTREPLEHVYLRHYHPRVHVRAPGDGVEPWPHVMIVPEPSGRDPADPAIALFEVFPPFAVAERDPANKCERFDFLDARRHLDMQFAYNGEAGTVTVCVVRRPPVEPAQSIEVGRRARLNLALGRPARQSSTLGAAVAVAAVDGRTEPDSWGDTVAHTQYERQPWWEVDLGSVREIDEVHVWNRADCCRERLRAFHVLVSDTPFGTGDLVAALRQPGVTARFVSGPAGRPSVVPVRRAGRYVRVQLAESNVLNLAEVQVWGRKAPRARGAVEHGVARAANLTDSRTDSTRTRGVR